MVGIALLTLAPGRMGGSETYARGLTAALSEHGRESYLVGVPPDAVDAASSLPYVVAGAAGDSPRPVALLRAALARSTFRTVGVVHYPLTIALPAPAGRHVVTLHDVLHLDLPELVPRRTRQFRRFAYDRAARRADLVIVPSEFVRERAVRWLRLDPGRVRVVHHAVDTSVFHARDRTPEPFLLYPARAWRHKNHDLLFDAFARVRSVRPELDLVLTGGGHERFATLPDGVRSLGNVSVAELSGLYRRASAVVFPSLYEGFGLPVLEALASGCPVVAIAGTAVEEVASAPAVTFAAPEMDAFANGIMDALAVDSAVLEAAAEAAAGFTWQRVAASHEEIYAEVGSA